MLAGTWLVATTVTELADTSTGVDTFKEDILNSTFNVLVVKLSCEAYYKPWVHFSRPIICIYFTIDQSYFSTYFQPIKIALIIFDQSYFSLRRVTVPTLCCADDVVVHNSLLREWKLADRHNNYTKDVPWQGLGQI